MRSANTSISPKGGSAAEIAVPSYWILSVWQDLFLFVATPLLIIPVYVVLRGELRGVELAAIVFGLGGVGHHLPGMMRAYGDRALFSRYKVRLIVAPLFLLLVCAYFAWRELHALNVILFFWALWHLLAQTYGFLRIYDAKVGSFEPLTSWLDRAMCLAWFVGPAIVAGPRSADMLTGLYQSGFPLLSMNVIDGLRWVWAIVTGAITLVYVGNFIRCYWQERRQNPVKLPLLAVTIAYWWFCMMAFQHVIIGVALFEVFHDTQYLAIVWIYNRNRVDKDPQVGSFTAFLFRRSGALMGLYIGLALGYGALVSFSPDAIPMETVRRVVIGALLASTFLHYYFDGFIWRVRERSTRQSLGVDRGRSKRDASAAIDSWSGWVRHGAYWCLFVIPLAAADAFEASSTRAETVWRKAVVDAVPDCPVSRFNLGSALMAANENEAAAVELRSALERFPNYDEALYNLANLSTNNGDFDLAAKHYRRAVESNPKFVEARSNLASVLSRLGDETGAVEQYQKALNFEPHNPRVHFNLASLFERMEKHDDARRHYALAVDHDTSYAKAHFRLGRIHHRQGRLDEAVHCYWRALEIQPDLDVARRLLNKITQEQGKMPDNSGLH